MTPLLALLAGGVVVWAWYSGKLRALRIADVAAAAAALIGLRLVGKQPIVGGLILAGAALWLVLRMRRTPAPLMPADEARAVLDLPPNADAAMVQEAHRRLIARVHPDAGGSEELARRVNLARDALLTELNRDPPRAS